ncbi:MAG TPA: hypothetical protein VJ464_20780, partial [Blastocatellia bacterium]|nr:hypothetical protein [Blastocatellia bacterium]
LNDVSSGTTHYLSQFSYTAHGGVKDLKLGNNLWQHVEFDPYRLQPTACNSASSMTRPPSRTFS